MGIPSYYRKLCDTVPGLLHKQLPSSSVESLWIDFNCIIYHCIHKPGTPAYTGENDRINWENQLIKIICSYTEQLVAQCKPTKSVFIGIDGVVPMAKMRQQRKRRFKSIWVTEHEHSLGKPFEERWDTNSITPGTEFMDTLAKSLQDLCKKKNSGPKWILSSANEPGEGEQKLFHSMNSITSDIAIYGLDADLILMSLHKQLTTVPSLWLFREHSDFMGKTVYTDNKEEYRWLHIPTLATTLGKHCKIKDELSAYLMDYIGCMMILGNDFMPHSLWFTIRDGGYALLEELIIKINKSHGQIITDNKWNKDALIELFNELAIREDSSLEFWIHEKMKKHPRRSKDAIESWQQNIDDWNQFPIQEKDEKRLLNGNKLSPKWRNIYYEDYLSAISPVDIQARVDTYIEGLSWSLAYITGSNEMSWSWMYPWTLPPLWKDIVTGLKKTEMMIPVSPNLNIQPQEQLALVLPLSSWWLIRDKNLRCIPNILPHFWKFKLTFCTAGKRMMWECDPHVPLFTPERLRFLQSKTLSPNSRWDKHNPKDLILLMSEYIKS
jgi:5'-3' exonuclease